MGDWLKDEREILSVRLPAEKRAYSSATGDKFERVQYPAEYCYVPWLRITSYFSAEGIYGGPARTFEVPLNSVAMIQFATSTHRMGD